MPLAQGSFCTTIRGPAPRRADLARPREALMRVYHLNCVSACPLGGLLMDGVPAPRLRARLTSHCLLVETGAGLVLIDTGYGLRDVRDPHCRLSGFFLALNQPALREEMTAVRQIA